MTGIRSRFIRTSSFFALLGAVLCFAGAPVFGQSVPVLEAANAKVVDQDPAPAPVPAKKDAGVMFDRFLATGVIEADKYVPMTGRQRVTLYWKSTFFSPGVLFGTVFPALGDQAGGNPPEWGGGMAGFGRRVGSRFGVRTITETFQHAGAAALGHDPRYIRSGKKGFLKRSGHALAFVFVTYNNEGKIRPAFAKVGGIYGGGITQIAWMPDRFNVRGDGIRNGNVGMAVQLFNNLILEFAPDLRKIFRRK